jgi:uncharacterized protein
MQHGPRWQAGRTGERASDAASMAGGLRSTRVSNRRARKRDASTMRAPNRREATQQDGGQHRRKGRMASMFRGGLGIAAAIAIIGIAASSTGWTGRASAGMTQSQDVNRGVVELEIGSSAGISVPIAEDLAGVIDDGATRRVLPVLGKGSLQNLTDLRQLHGIDLAILQTDVLDYAKQNLFPGLDNEITYVAKLYNEEFHLLARAEIKKVTDLANQKVNVDLRGASTAITAGRIFDLLKIAIVPTYDMQKMALEKLRKGDIAALAFVAGKPAPIFRDLIDEDGLHFVSIPLDPTVTAVYAPAKLTALDYPGLIQYNQPVDTVAVETVLLAADLQPLSERYRNLVNFVDAFFTEFPTLLQPGHNPKWQEVNLRAELPGWRRFPAAADWLQRNAPVAAAPGDADLKAIFARFLDERQRATGGQPLSPQQKDDLFGQFERWEKSQSQ